MQKRILPKPVKPLFILLITLLLCTLGLTASVDNLWYDFLVQYYAPVRPVSDRAVEVYIRDETAGAMNIKGLIPPPVYARFIRKCRDLGARVIVMNLFFSPSSTVSYYSGLLDSAGEAGNVVFRTGKKKERGADVIVEPFGLQERSSSIRLAHGEMLSQGGLCRAINPTLISNGRKYTALAYSAFDLYNGNNAESLKAGSPEYICYVGDSSGSGHEEMSGLEPDGRERHFLEDWLEKEFPKDHLKDRAVFLGYLSESEHDFFFTPLGLMSGTALHAMIFQNLLEGRHLEGISPLFTIFLTVLFSCLSLVNTSRFRAFDLFGVFFFLSFLLLAASTVMFMSSLVFLPATSFVSLSCSYILLLLAKHRESAEKLRASLREFEKMMEELKGDCDEELRVRRILNMAISSAGATVGWIMMGDEHGAPSIIASTFDRLDAEPEMLEGSLTWRAAASGVPSVLRVKRGGVGSAVFEERQRLSALICIPMKIGQKSTAALAVARTEGPPFDMRDLRSFTYLGAFLQIYIENRWLNEKIQKLFIEAITSLAQAIDARDPYTYGHSVRVAELGCAIAREIHLSPDHMKSFEIACLLHDIGKIGVSEEILHKPGKLSDEEFATMKKHPGIGEDILKPLGEMFDIIPAVRSHHEKLDGKGYPRGLSAEEIPLEARILAVADVYDALSSDRPYRKALSREESLTMMKSQFNGHLDERFIAILESCLDKEGGL